MRIISCKFGTFCKESGTKIEKGQLCLFDVSNRALYSIFSRRYKMFKNQGV